MGWDVRGGSGGATIRIVVDDRESRIAIVGALLAQMEGVTVTVKRLQTGDYFIEEKAVLERKRVPDFLESLFQGRLFAQARRLAESPVRSFLILEGPSSEWTQRHIKREAVQGAMLTLSVVFGIPVLRSQDEAETARLILYTAQQMQSVSSSTWRRPGRSPRGKRALQIRVLSSLPRVGTKRALRLLDHFGTLEKIVAAPLEELLLIPGIGQQTAQSIHWAVHEECISYHM
ncbi:MAG: helix-hairpin-helix domain-containing protein [Acidobacteria bacterium]|nr:helix-hairpin-helix domain-containing protein [Acidobacteriota bacterium]